MTAVIKFRAIFGPFFVRLVDRERPAWTPAAKFPGAKRPGKSRASARLPQKIRAAGVLDTHNGIHEVRSSILLGSTILHPCFCGVFSGAGNPAQFSILKNAICGPFLKPTKCRGRELFFNNLPSLAVSTHRNLNQTKKDK